MELAKRNQSFTLLAGTRPAHAPDVRVPVQKCLWTDCSSFMALERNVYMQFARFFSLLLPSTELLNKKPKKPYPREPSLSSKHLNQGKWAWNVLFKLLINDLQSLFFVFFQAAMRDEMLDRSLKLGYSIQ